MDAVSLFSGSLGLSYLAGMRLYATVVALGLALRLGWFEPSGSFEGLRVLGTLPVLIPAGVLLVVEALVDKVPWLDSLWDAMHTFLRPVGAALLGVASLGQLDPSLAFVCYLLFGAVGLAAHTGKAGTRLLANQSPEPVSNATLSFSEEAAVLGGLWLIHEYPLVAGSMALLLLALVAMVVVLLVRSSRAIGRSAVRAFTALTRGGLRALGQLRRPGPGPARPPSQ
jgi:hypothetical protein